VAIPNCEEQYDLLSLFVFKGSQEGSAVLFPQKKVTKENSRLRLLLLVLMLLLLVWLPNQTMPVL